MAYEYTTISLVEAEIRAETTFATDTVPSISQVSSWIQEESEMINTDAGAVFGSTQYTTDIDYDGSDEITLQHAPVISVDSLTYATARLGTDDYATSFVAKTEDTDYMVDYKKGIIRPLFNNWSPSEGFKRINIVYTAGYTNTPLDIRKLATKKVALRVLNSLIHSNVNEGNDGGSISVGSISIVEPDGISVTTYKQLQEDIRELEAKLTNDSFGIYRYEGY